MTRPTRPFTVIGGFLGAGKTTLVNRILSDANGVRYAVMVNDFGSVNVDADLIAAHDGRTMALTNGCICCSLADGFITAMLRLMQEPESFDHVIVEASGVSMPDRIMDLARLDPALDPDAVIVLLDAETQAARLGDKHVGEVVAAQIESADIVLVTKLDLAGDGAFGLVREAVRRLNTTAAILACDPAGIEVDALLGTKAVNGGKTGRSHPQVAFHTVTFEATSSLSSDAFARFTATLPASVIRGKGSVALEGEEDGLHWQRVGARTNATPLKVPPDVSRIVLIGTEPLTDLPNVPIEMKILS